MHSNLRMLGLGAASLLSLCWNSPTSAAPMAVDEVVLDLLAPVPGISVGRSTPLGVPALGPDALARKRGGTVTLSDMRLKGVVADNQAVNVTTGGNVISEGALAGATGLPTVIQNSGNNVLIQNATIVNVQLK